MDEKQIEKMLAMAASKLGMSPEQLKASAMSGDVDQILSRMDKGSADKVRSAMKDKDLAEKLAQKYNKK